MKLRVLSDLHLEFQSFDLNWFGEDVMVLAGDLSPNIDDAIALIVKYLDTAPLFADVVVVLGNHDYYTRTINETIRQWREVNIPRLHFLQNTSVVLHGYRFCGTTLWTDINNANKVDISKSVTFLNDYRAIQYFTADTFMTEHTIAKQWLEKEVANSDLPVIVVTHHLPSSKSQHPKYLNSPIAYSFMCTDMTEIIAHPKVAVWCHGHTHSSRRYIDNGTEVVCNPHGYRTENAKEFDPNLILKI